MLTGVAYSFRLLPFRFLFCGACSSPAAVPTKERSLLSLRYTATHHISCACLLVLEHCVADQVFLIPFRGVHRVTEQLASGTPSLAILYGREAIRFLGSVITRLLASSPSRTPTTTSRTTTSSLTSTSSSATCLHQPTRTGRPPLARM